MDLVYEIFDKYMAEKDKLFLFYMVVAMIMMNEKVLDILKKFNKVNRKLLMPTKAEMK